MSRREIEAAALLAAPDREAYLLAHSGLPGARSNLELLAAASEACDRNECERWAAMGPDAAALSN